MKLLLCALVCLGCVLVVTVSADPWAATLDPLLDREVANHSFPGCVAIVTTRQDGIVYHKAHGMLTYGEAAPFSPPNTPMTLTTLFDIASLTKVVATTTATMVLYQRGLLSLDMYATDILGPAYGANGKSTIRLSNLMLHNAGYPPDPVPNYWDPAFGCPGVHAHVPPEDFNCSQKIYGALLAQPLINPVGAVYIYSDLSMITMMYIVGTVVQAHGLVPRSALLPACVAGCGGAGPACSQCYYEAFVRDVVVGHNNMTLSGFLPPVSLWGTAAPTWNDTVRGWWAL
jgi:CubicO group peptidase (beta-lactamase class C family)